MREVARTALRDGSVDGDQYDEDELSEELDEDDEEPDDPIDTLRSRERQLCELFRGVAEEVNLDDCVPDWDQEAWERGAW